MISTVAIIVELAKTPLTENEASVIWAMGKCEIVVKDDAIRGRTNEERHIYGLADLSEQQFHHAIDRLIDLRCLERAGIFSYILLEEISFTKVEYLP